MPTIRPAVPADRPAIERIVHDAYSPFIPRIGREPGPMLDDCGALIAAGHVHVLETAGVVRGLVVLVDDGEVLLLDNVAVSPADQGRGYGRMLIAFAEEEARQRGSHAIRLYTNECMTENIALYGRLGFKETHRGEEKGFRRVFMIKAL